MEGSFVRPPGSTVVQTQLPTVSFDVAPRAQSKVRKTAPAHTPRQPARSPRQLETTSLPKQVCKSEVDQLRMQLAQSALDLTEVHDRAAQATQHSAIAQSAQFENVASPWKQATKDTIQAEVAPNETRY